MKLAIKPLISNLHILAARRFFQVTGFLSLLCVGSMTLLPIWQLFPGLQNKLAIPLHYNIHFGVDLFGAWWQIFTIPAVGTLILFINFVGALYLWRREKVLSYFFATGTVLIELIFLVGMVFIVLLNLAYGV